MKLCTRNLTILSMIGSMMIDHCEMVKQGRADAQDFDDFLKHVSDCKDCQRRIGSQIVTNFRQRQMEINNGN
jgi:hypothetical protein